jgi:hypothetical protein
MVRRLVMLDRTMRKGKEFNVTIQFGDACIDSCRLRKPINRNGSLTLSLIEIRW